MVLKTLSLLHACLYAGRAGKSHVMALICQLPFDLQSTIVRSSAALPKHLRLYAIYLEMRKTLFQSGQRLDLVACKWVAAEEKRDADTKSKQRAFAASSTNLRARRMSCLSVKEGLLDEASLLIDLLQALVAALSKIAQTNPEGTDELLDHALSILENDLFHLTQAVVEASVSVLGQSFVLCFFSGYCSRAEPGFCFVAVFTKLNLEEARAALAFYARALEGIQAAKACARHNLPASRGSISSLKLPSSDLFLALADHVGKLSEEAEKADKRSAKDRIADEKSWKDGSHSAPTEGRGGDCKTFPNDVAPVRSKGSGKGHSRIASLPESLTAPKTALLKGMSKAFRHS